MTVLQGRSVRSGGSIVAGAVLVNLLLFLGVPLLLHHALPQDRERYDAPVMISRAPPPQLPEEAPRPKPPSEKPPPEIRNAPAERPMRNEPRPRLNIEPPPLDLRISGQVSAGVSLDSLGIFGTGYEIGNVDAPPRLIRKLDPVYPYSARRRKITGTVTVRFLVDVDGYVQHLAIQEATPPGVFDEPVRAAVAKWRFTPGKIGDRAVATWMVLPLSFDLE